MIKLYSFGKKFGVADPSPFVLKVDAYMRIAGVQFESIAHPNNLRKAPKGKLPFIDDNGSLVSDSQDIILHLKKNPEHDLDHHLTNEQKAISYLVTKSLDENLYFILVYSRWMRDDTWPTIKKAFFGKMPFPLKQIVPGIARKQIIKNLKGQGIARHSNEEILKLLHFSLKALTDLLGNKTYFFGDKISSLDATVYGLLAEFTLVTLENPFNTITNGYPCLVKYCKNIHGKYYS
jgi:glutathione S-transferase